MCPGIEPGSSEYQSDALNTTPTGLLGIGAENITTSVVILHSPQVNSVLETQSLHVRGMTSTPKYLQTGMRNIPNLT